MRVLIAPQEFKGTLTSQGATEAIAAGFRRAKSGLDLDLLPMADGGPGTLDALVAATGGNIHQARVQGPLGAPRVARWGSLGGAASGTAIVEMAEASGLVLLSPAERDPRRASTFGTGELLRNALDAGFRRVIVGVGGSATNDGGAGAAQALGVRLLDGQGAELPPGGVSLVDLARIDTAGRDPRLAETRVTIAADVTNSLCGPEGASFVYGPQKGGDPVTVRELDAALTHFAEVVERDLGLDLARVPGAGAAGGLAYGLMVFCGADLRPGFDVVAEAVGFSERVRRADLVVTGEGRLDRQSGFGKTTAGVARVAHQQGKPVVAIVGRADVLEGETFNAVFEVAGASTDDLPDKARVLLEQATELAASELLRRGLLW